MTDNKKSFTKPNFIADILKVLAGINLIIGFIYGVRIELEYLVNAGLVFVGIYALAEIIQILHDIREKLYQK